MDKEEKDEDFEIIRCFQHCSNETNIFYSCQLPTICPLCGDDVINSDSLLPPYRISSPFTTAGHHPFAVVIKPTLGTFLLDYQNSANLHIGLTNSQGVVYEYDENGVGIGSLIWTQCIAVSFRDLLLTRSLSKWDNQLDHYSHLSTWTPQRYDEDKQNCFSFVMEFLQLIGILSAETSKQNFLTQFIIKHTTKASKYIYIHRQTLQKGFLCQPAQTT